MSIEQIRADVYTSYSPTDDYLTRRVFEAARDRAYQALSIMIEIDGLNPGECLSGESGEAWRDVLLSRPDGLLDTLDDLLMKVLD